MKRIVCAALLAVVMATPAFAARLYLKEGGFIEAKRVWRSGGRVNVLATRDTLTSFAASEVDLKKTFPHRRRAPRRVAAVAPAAQAAAAAPAGAADAGKPAGKKPGVSLPALPKLPEKSPESLLPTGGGGGTIRQHKKEMNDKIGE